MTMTDVGIVMPQASVHFSRERDRSQSNHMVYHRRKGAQLVISPVHETPTGWIPGNPDVHHPTPVILNHWWGWGGQFALQGTSGSGDIFGCHNGERVTQVSNG